MVNVVVSGVEGREMNKSGFQGLGYEIKAPYSDLGTKIRHAKSDLLKHLHKSTRDDEKPLLYSVSPPEIVSSMDDIHTLYLLVDEKSFGESVIPDELVRFEVPTQSCLHFHYQGSMNDITDFYYELFSKIHHGEINYDSTGYRIEEYGVKHNWNDKETTDNQLDIFFPIHEVEER